MEPSPSLETVPTPALVLDRGRCERNARRMGERMATRGVGLRPHLKTAKCAEVAALAIRGHPGGVTVSTVREAAWLAERGLRDVRLAVCPSPTSAEGSARLAAEGVRLSCLADSLAGVALLAEAAARHGTRLAVLVEVDTGEHRTGVPPESEALLAVARAVHAAPQLELAGVLTHGGHAYGVASRQELAAVAEQERAGVVAAAARVRDAGLPCPEVSAGSTPTASVVEDLSGVTEMRPGVYLFGDVFQAGLGTCALDDVALTVLTTVLAVRPDEGQLVLDAGGLALSKDRSTSGRPDDAGYGLVCDLAGKVLPGLRVDDVHQEHGAVRHVPVEVLGRVQVGDRLRVLPVHACMTAAAHDRYQVVDGDGPDVVALWERCNGW
jgi:D-serine deaminase-like pyridoxal phosphate-dependent protein